MSVLKGYINSLKYDLHILEAMAFKRKAGIDKLNEQLTPIIHHLVKIAIYKTTNKDRDENVEHWENEVLDMLDDIYDTCNSLKHGKRLKFKDYMLCLGDDLGRESQVQSKINMWSRKYKNKCNRDTDAESLRIKLWSILEAQFKGMANQKWSDFSLTNHPDYKELYSGGVK